MAASFPFEKIHACGNDFILLEFQPDQQLTAALCDRHHGIGADGILFWQLGTNQALELGHLDPDGSRTLCLNGLRAALAVLLQKGCAAPTGSLYYEGKQIAYETDGQRTRLEFDAQATCQQVSWDGPPAVRGYFVDIGNPHFVIVAPFEEARFRQCAAQIRADLNLNVHLIRPQFDGWSIRSFERGVEDFTLACASGMAASGIVIAQSLGQTQILFYPEGQGTVAFEQEDGKIRLGGPVAWVASGVWRC